MRTSGRKQRRLLPLLLAMLAGAALAGDETTRAVAPPDAPAAHAGMGAAGADVANAGAPAAGEGGNAAHGAEAAVAGKGEDAAQGAEAADPQEHGKAVHGQASWYGPGLDGRRTASGERFDRMALTAAHRSLPFGTLVRVQDLHSGRSVDVRINDRGPHAGRNRIIDLSEAAARAIGLGRRRGLAPVRISILKQPRR